MSKQDWETPWELFNKLDKAFEFTIDGAARADNTKCSGFITPEANAHTVQLSGESIFCNPPYANIDPWVTTFRRWSKGNLVVALLQDKTDTKWWRELVQVSSQVVILSGRVNFIGTETGNMHGAVVFVLEPPPFRQQICLSWNWQREAYPFKSSQAN